MIHILLSRGILGDSKWVPQFQTYILPKHRVCIVALSYFEEHIPHFDAYDMYYRKGGEYYQKMIDSFAPYGIKEEQITWIYHNDKNIDIMKKQIQNADILYFPGGAPDLMMKRIDELGLIETIEKHKRIVIGSSAGAMIQFAEYHISPDNEYHRFSLNKGLNWLDQFIIEVHYRRRKKQKSSLRKRHRETKKAIYGIPDDGAIVFDGQIVHCLGSARQLYNKKGVIPK